MKKVLFLMSIALIACVSMTVTSCSNEEEHLEKVTSVIHSKISKNEIKSIEEAIFKKVHTRTRSGIEELTEEEAMEILNPLYEEGLNLQEQILTNIKANPSEYTSSDVYIIESLQEEQLAMLAYVVAQVDYATDNDEEANESLEISIPPSKVMSCIAAAFGLEQIVEHALTPKAAIRLAWNLGKRIGLSWVGVALTVYSFVDCIS